VKPGSMVTFGMSLQQEAVKRFAQRSPAVTMELHGSNML
jgi:hypothetical protein